MNRLIVFLLVLLSTSVFANSLTPIYPNKLVKGDTVALITPSYKVTNKSLRDAKERVEALGYKVYIPDSVNDTYGCYGGTHEQRAAEINALFKNENVKALISVRGGAGASHIIDKLDYELIKNNLKILIGYSDVSVLLNAITNKTGLITFHGPMPAFAMPEFTVDYFKEVVEGRQVKFENEIVEEDDLIQTKNRIYTVKSGKARGRLIGGNFTVLSHMLGSDKLENFKDKILFVEDIGEDVYKIDRMLSQFKNAGILDEIAGFVFGTCEDCDIGCRGCVGIEETLHNYFDGYDIPVFYGAMIGHQSKIFTIPVGGLVEIDSDRGTISMLEPATK